MNSKIMLALLAAFSIMMTACGSSSSNDKTPNLKIDEDGTGEDPTQEPVDTTCFDQFQQAQNQQQCQDASDQANQWGYQPNYSYDNGQYNNGDQYNNGGGQYGNGNGGQYGNGNGGQYGQNNCGCDSGYVPTYVNGVLKCATQDTTISQSSVVTFGMAFKSKRGRTKVDETYVTFDYLEAADTQTHITNPQGNGYNCYVEAGCNPNDQYACSDFYDNYGNPVQAYCKPTQGYQGKCVRY